MLSPAKTPNPCKDDRTVRFALWTLRDEAAQRRLPSDVEAVEKPLFEPQKSLRMARFSSRHFQFAA
jgi:hypothetical protein